MADIKVKGLEKVIKKFKKMEKDFPVVRKIVINDMAFFGRKLYIRNAKKAFTLRNGGGKSDFTLRSIVVQKATSSATSDAIMGSTLKYMADQEFGNRRQKVTHIPTQAARVARNRTRRVRRPNYINRIGTASRRGRGRIAIRQAVMSARTRNERGPFKFTMNTRKGRIRGIFMLPRNKKRDLVMIHDISKDNVKIKSQGLLKKTIKPTIRMGPVFFNRNIDRFLSKS